MIMLSDIRDYIASLGLADTVYMSKLDSKPDKSIGVYNSKHQHGWKTAIGGPDLESYKIKYITLLIHYNTSPRETETVAMALFDALVAAREVEINGETIKFILPLYDIQDVGTDDAGVYEMVIDAAFICGKG